MKILQFKLNNYKPLIHSNLHKICLSFNEDVQLIIGNNGRGKSSLINAFNPLPIVSTMFDKHGFYELTIEHNTNTYILKAEFDKSKTYSFIENDKELNISGTTSVQQDLCKKYFSYTPLIDKLTCNRLSIANMRISERKEFFLSTYPNDMSFILTYYKKINSKIRELKNNLKLLTSKQIMLKDKLMNDDQLSNLKNMKQELTTFYNKLDNTILILTNENKNYTKQLNNTNINITDIKNSCINIRKKVNKIKKNSTIYKNTNINHESNYKVFKNSKEFLEKQTIELDNEIVDLKTELDTLNTHKDLNVKEELEHLTNKIRLTKEHLGKTEFDKNIPTLSENKLLDFKQNKLSRLNDIINTLSNNKIISKKVLHNIENKIQEYKFNIQELETSINNCKKEIENNEIKYVVESKFKYPVECIMVCDLKANLDKRLREISSNINRNKDNLIKFKNSKKTYLELISKLNNYISFTKNNFNLIESLEHIIHWNNWTDYIFKDTNLIYLLNNNIFDIQNKINKIIINSDNKLMLDKLNKDIENYNYKLNTLKDIQIPTNDLINKTILNKQTSLNKKLDKYNTLQKDLLDIKNNCFQTEDILEQCKTFEKLKTISQKYITDLAFKSHIKFNNEIIEDINFYRRKVKNKLEGLDTTLEEQNNYHVRLNDEVLPYIKSISEQLTNYEYLEKALSPTNGMPHIYLITYINNLIKLVNHYISLVWEYELELELLDEHKPLTYNLPFIINKSTRVKDINMGSTAQKKIIDLAFTLAICNYLQISKDYPLRIDEIDAFLSQSHGIALIDLLSSLLKEEKIKQLFIVSQHNVFFTSFQNSNIIQLEDGKIKSEKNKL